MQIVLFYLVKFLLSLRYRIILKGMTRFRKSSSQLGTLFLANHVALMDPVVLEYVLWRRYKPCPVSVDYLFKDKMIAFLLHKVHAVSVPSFSLAAKKDNLEAFNETCTQIVSRLSSGKNVLMYPSGRLSDNGKENIKEQSLTFKILQQLPNVSVVLLRTEGFWGSSFSKYPSGKTPSLSKVFSQSVKYALRGGIFFLPKRTIIIHAESCNDKSLHQLDKVSLNAFLEERFNETSKENVLSIVPYE